MKDTNLIIKKVTTFQPSPDILRSRAKAISKAKDALGERYLLHPVNHVKKRPTAHPLLTLWLATRIEGL